MDAIDGFEEWFMQHNQKRLNAGFDDSKPAEKMLACVAWQAARAKPVDWREHSKNFAKGVTPPQTLESLQAAWDRDQEVIDDLRKEVSVLKGTVNQLRQAKAKPVVPEGWKLVPVEPTPGMIEAAEEAYMPFGDMDIALRMAMLAADPKQKQCL